MADRAEQRALETYPMETGGVDYYPISRAGYIAGYHQAEKDILEWLRNQYSEEIQAYFGIDICEDLKEYLNE